MRTLFGEVEDKPVKTVTCSQCGCIIDISIPGPKRWAVYRRLRQGLPLYCGVKCGNTSRILPPLIITCFGCGKDREVSGNTACNYRQSISRGHRVFCSTKCSDDVRRGVLEHLDCVECGKALSRNQLSTRRVTRSEVPPVCSVRCARQITWRKLGKGERYEGACAYCKKNMILDGMEAYNAWKRQQRDRYVTCSKECARDLRTVISSRRLQSYKVSSTAKRCLALLNKVQGLPDISIEDMKEIQKAVVELGKAGDFVVYKGLIEMLDEREENKIDNLFIDVHSVKDVENAQNMLMTMAKDQVITYSKMFKSMRILSEKLSLNEKIDEFMYRDKVLLINEQNQMVQTVREEDFKEL